MELGSPQAIFVFFAFFVANSARTFVAIRSPLATPCTHHLGTPTRARVAAVAQAVDRAGDVRIGAVLAELPFAFETRDGDLDPDDAVQHRVDERRGRVSHL